MALSPSHTFLGWGIDEIDGCGQATARSPLQKEKTLAQRGFWVGVILNLSLNFILVFFNVLYISGI